MRAQQSRRVAQPRTRAVLRVGGEASDRVRAVAELGQLVALLLGEG